MDDREARELVASVEALLDEVEALPDPAAREKSTELVGALLELYGEGLARVAARVSDPALLADDELVSHLLLLHGIHPVPVEVRVRAALDEVRPYLESHGGNVELVEIGGGVVRLRMEGSCSGCPSSAMTLKLAIEDAIHKHAPEVEEIAAQEADSAPEPSLIQLGTPAPSPAPSLIQLTPLEESGHGHNGAAEGANGGAGAVNVAWATVGPLSLADGGSVLVDVAGDPLLFLRVDGTFYAYRPSCAACGQSLEHAQLRGVELECAGCGHGYDVSRAGRSITAPERHLNPVPLLVDEAGIVKVALAPAPA